ncbi:translation initiation factor Sui1|nr:translation initiation factor Sui1 [Candidatus Pantoea persica]
MSRDNPQVYSIETGRKGKGVCLITGFDLDDDALAKLGAELKKKCGCGGAVKV